MIQIVEDGRYNGRATISPTHLPGSTTPTTLPRLPHNQRPMMGEALPPLFHHKIKDSRPNRLD